MAAAIRTAVRRTRLTAFDTFHHSFACMLHMGLGMSLESRCHNPLQHQTRLVETLSRRRTRFASSTRLY
jgi:hypothetical protein